MKILNNGEYLLLIDEEVEIKKYYSYYLKDNKDIIKYMGDTNEPLKENEKVIIAYYPLNSEAKELDLSLLPNPFKEVDVEKLAQEYTMSIFGELDDFIDITEGFIAGYKSAQQSNKQFSLEDIENAFYMGWIMRGEGNNFPIEKRNYIQSLSTQQLPKEFIPEFIDNGEEDWIGDDINGEPFWNEKLELKTITNSEGKEIVQGKYVY